MLKRQTDREGGEILILHNRKVESLSTPTELSFAVKITPKNPTGQTNGEKFSIFSDVTSNAEIKGWDDIMASAGFKVKESLADYLAFLRKFIIDY